MSTFKLTGVIHAMMLEQTVSDKFKKQEFVLKIEDDKYPNFPKFQAVNDRISLLQSFTVGDEVTVHFDIQGKEYVKGSETLYFTSLNMWKIEGVKDSPSKPKETGRPNEEVDMDLPF